MTARQQIRVGRLGRERSAIDAQPAPSVGELLQSAREKKGVDLFRAERDTKIRARHLAALESGDYAELPGAVYIKGFLRNYALYLGLDPEEVLTRWRDEQDYGRAGEPVASVAPPPQPIAEPRRGLTFTPGIAIAALLTVVVLAFAGYIALQLVRFTQVPEVTLQGDRILRLAPDATTVLLRGGAGPAAIVSISGPDGHIIQTATADEAGAWVAELGVSKGRNDFTLVARDPDTGRESPPLQVIATVPVPATPAPPATAPPGGSPGPAASGAASTPGAAATPGAVATPGAPATPAPTLAPGATPAPQPTPASTAGAAATAPPAGVAARLEVTAPVDLANIQNAVLAVSGRSDANAVSVSARWLGPAGQEPTGEPGDGPSPQGPQSLRVRDGVFRGSLTLPNGRWSVTVTTGGGVAPTVVERVVDVRHTGLFVTVEARNGNAWIRVWVDGELAEEGRTFRRGEVEAFSARRSVVVSSGNAGATYVVINGEPHGMIGQGGQIATMQFEKGKEPRTLS